MWIFPTISLLAPVALTWLLILVAEPALVGRSTSDFVEAGTLSSFLSPLVVGGLIWLCLVAAGIAAARSLTSHTRRRPASALPIALGFFGLGCLSRNWIIWIQVRSYLWRVAPEGVPNPYIGIYFGLALLGLGSIVALFVWILRAAGR